MSGDAESARVTFRVPSQPICGVSICLLEFVIPIALPPYIVSLGKMHLLLISYEGAVEKVRDVLCPEQRKRSGFFAVDQFVIGHFQHFAESLQLDIRDIAFVCLNSGDDIFIHVISL